MEAVFQRLEGVEKVVSGYAGGKVKDPTYREVCYGRTGHAEVVQITYNPDIISYQELLEIFFATHNPTTLNQQGNDVGTQYRSVIYYHNDTQKQIAEDVKQAVDASGEWKDPVVTEISPLPEFYVAEDYHQNYFNDNGQAPYCQFVVKPKVEKLIKSFSQKLREQAL